MFVDEINLELFAGKGGDGIVSYRREYMVEKGGPYGGTGGRGGDIIFVGDGGINTLLDLRYKRKIKGFEGVRGGTKGKTGANAENTYVRVPVGTIIYNAETNKVIADITYDGMEAVIAKGGRGGRGNMAFATGINKCPDIAEKGEPGEHVLIHVELKVLADCGLVGFPSVGKSTIISRMSAAKPEIASYHFTTLSPNLGMVYVDNEKSFVMADLPGLIEGAHLGLGLGIEFLRHIERCRVIVHVIDMSQSEMRDAYQDYLAINNELKEYKMNLLKRPQIIVANKMDIEGAKENLEAFKKHFEEDTEIIEISSLMDSNLDKLKYKIMQTLDNTEPFDLFEIDEHESFVNYEFKKKEEFFKIEITDDGIYNVIGDGLKRLFDMTNFNNEADVKRFARQLRSYGVDEKLRSLGVKNGDTVRIFSYEFEFID